MDKLKTIKLINFQKHGKLTVALSPEVTTFVGENGAGKSSVVRALRLLSLGKPGGGGWVKQGASRGGVQITIDECSISRTRSGSTNSYTIDKKKLAAFGQIVPEEVADKIKLTDVNFQLQFDRHFWLSLTPGELSKELNSIVNLEKIDAVLNALATKNKRESTVLSLCKARLAESEVTSSKLDWVEPQLKVLSAIDAKLMELGSKKRKLADLQHIINELQDLEQLANIKLPTKQVQAIDTLIQQLESKRKQMQDLTEIITELIEQETALLSLQKEEREAADQLALLAKERCPLCGRKNLV